MYQSICWVLRCYWDCEDVVVEKVVRRFDENARNLRGFVGDQSTSLEGVLQAQIVSHALRRQRLQALPLRARQKRRRSHAVEDPVLARSTYTTSSQE